MIPSTGCVRKRVCLLLGVCAAACFAGGPLTQRSSNASEVVRVWEARYPKPTFAGLSPDGKRMWRADVHARRVSVLDPSNGKELRKIAASATYATFSPDSDRLLLREHERQRFVVADSNGIVTGECPYPDGVTLREMKSVRLSGIQMSRDPRDLYIALRGGKLLRIDLKRNKSKPVFDWRDYRDEFNLGERRLASVRVDAVTGRTVVGRVNDKLFTLTIDENERPRLKVDEGKYSRFAQVDWSNQQVFLTTWGEDSRFPSRVAVFDMKGEKVRLGRDLHRRLPRLMFVSESRNRLVEIPAAGDNRPSTMLISDLRSGESVEAVPCAPAQVFMLSADAQCNSWLTVDDAGNISLWKWKDRKK